MGLLLIYVLLLIVGETAAVYLGLFLDKVAPALSLPIALALFFSMLVGAWYAAVAISDKFFPDPAGN